MDAAEVKSPCMQSASGSRAKSFGTATLALRPRCPNAAATQPRTASSGMSRREVMSEMVASSTDDGATPFVNSARCCAALICPMSDAADLTARTVCSSSEFSTGLVLAFAGSGITATKPTRHKHAITQYLILCIKPLYGAVHALTTGAVALAVERSGLFEVAGNDPAVVPGLFGTNDDGNVKPS